jgi:hypothetical protein
VRERDVTRAEVALVVPPPSQGVAEIVPVVQGDGAGDGGGLPAMLRTSSAYFVFQMNKYCHVGGVADAAGGGSTGSTGGMGRSGSEGTFRALDYPYGVQNRSFFRGYRGHAKGLEAAARGKWGGNVFDIPLPAFWDILQTQLVAPFFIFQVFCVTLWCLDDYWYYSLFTLAMLVVSEMERQRDRETERQRETETEKQRERRLESERERERAKGFATCAVLPVCVHVDWCLLPIAVCGVHGTFTHAWHLHT